MFRAALAAALAALSAMPAIDAHAVTAQAPNARLAGLIGFNAETNQVLIERRKGIRIVTHPAMGTYCVFPVADLFLHLGRIVPMVQTTIGDVPDRGLSTAYWIPENVACPANAIEVATFDVNVFNGAIERMDTRRFTIIVP